MKNKEIEELLNKIQECDSLHNNCDYLLEHDECYILIEYIEQLEKENQQLNKQKDDVVEYIKTTTYSDITGLERHNITEFWFVKDLLRMLGEIDE